jgi:peptidoglycan/LPS O-acetylase OafA/YrhL
MTATTAPRIEKPNTMYTPQVCRGLACLLVAIYHAVALVGIRYGVKPLLDLTSFGFSGVHMFFVISGLIIYHAHCRDMDNYRRVPDYLLKRLVRIYPFYWIVLLVMGGWKVFANRMAIDDFMSNALLFSSNHKVLVAVSWTLAYEMIFYCLFIAFIVKRALGLLVFAIWFAMVALNHHFNFAALIGLNLINLLFMLGLLTSVTLMTLRERLAPNQRDAVGIGSLIAGTLIFVATACWYVSLHDPNLLVWDSLPLALGFGIGSALLLLASLSSRIEGALQRQRLLLLIGDASYSIYLVHFFFQTRVYNGIRSLGWVPTGEKTQSTALLLLAVLMVLSVGGGILVHKLVEKPLLAKCRHWLRLLRADQRTGPRTTSPSL